MGGNASFWGWEVGSNLATHPSTTSITESQLLIMLWNDENEKEIVKTEP